MFRTKEDRFIFTEAGDAYNSDNVLKYLGQTIPVCPYTNSTVDVVKFPVDFNQQNSTPSNMHYISKAALAKEGDIVMTDLEMFINRGPTITVTFYAPTFVLDKHMPEVEHLLEKLDESDIQLLRESPTEGIYALWDTLIFNNAKGIFGVKLGFQEQDSRDILIGRNVRKVSTAYYAESQFVMGKISAKMAERGKLASTSKIQL